MGSTPVILGLVFGIGDHPHIHGEHLPLVLPPSLLPGSPPYTWGALKHRNIFEVWQGITPIYMGSTMPVISYTRPRQDHPHIHGEHLALAFFNPQ